MKRVMLYFGSFNPVHRGHIALAEYVVGQGLCDEAVLVVSPQSPYKQAAELAPEMDRFEMAEIACAASKYPDRIKPSVVDEGVAAYIRRKGLWSPATRIAALGAQIAAEPGNTALLVERGKLHYRMGEWGPALNDFNAALRIDDTHVEAKEFARMVQEILEFRYKDIYNP